MAQKSNNNKPHAPVKVTEAEGKEKALKTAMEQIEKNFGKGAVMRLGENVAMNVGAIHTGSLTLDLALGIGGILAGLIGRAACGDGQVKAGARQEIGDAVGRDAGGIGGDLGLGACSHYAA